MTLEQVRLKLGINQMEAAGRADISLATWIKYESGPQAPSIKLLKILQAFSLVAIISSDGHIEYKPKKQI